MAVVRGRDSAQGTHRSTLVELAGWRGDGKVTF
jgi:hypothetical protein